MNGTVTDTTVYGYDNNGNMLTTTVDSNLTVTNTYDELNQLIQTDAGTTTVINTYNGEGLRVSKSVDGTLTRYLYEYDKVVLETNSSNVQTARNVYGTNLLMRDADGESYYYMYNGHADVTALLETDGAIAGTYYYDAFGNMLEHTGNVNNSINYAGYQYDKETGIYYLNSRMYDPKIARFLQEDDSSYVDPNDPLSLNLYTYAVNNPIRYYDPDGHFFKEIWGGVKKGASWVGDKASNAWDTTTSAVSSGYNYVNDNVIQPAATWTNENVVKPVVQTYRKTADVVSYAIENAPSTPKDVLAMGTGFAVTSFKNNVYDPLLVDLPTVVGAFTGVPNIMEYRQEMQNRGDILENRLTNSLGVQDNEYYYAGGTIASAFDMGKGAVEVIGGGVIFTIGTGITGASIGGAAPTGGVSLVGTLAGVPAMALGAAVGGHGVSSAISGYNTLNQNYNKFDAMTGGSSSKRTEYLGRTPGKNSRTGRDVIKKMEEEGKIRTVRGKKEFQASDGEWYSLDKADMSHKTNAVSWWNETGRDYGAKSKEVRNWMLDPNNYFLDHFSINRSQGAKLTENYLPPTKK